MVIIEPPDTQPKLIFGLNPKQTIIHSVIMFTLSTIGWLFGFFTQISDSSKLDNFLIESKKINIPWFYDMPMFIVGTILVLSFIDYKYVVKYNEFFLRKTLYNCFYGIFIPSLYMELLKVIVLLIYFYL